MGTEEHAVHGKTRVVIEDKHFLRLTGEGEDQGREDNYGGYFLKQ
jgi:hypothetical protein